MTALKTLPVLPLREFVLFPGVTTPINAGRPGTLRAIEAALATPDRMVFAVSQRQNLEGPEVTPENLHTIGTVARIGQLQRGLGSVQLLLHGDHRGIAMRITQKDGEKEGYLQAVVRDAEEMAPLAGDDPAFLALLREARARAAELGRRSGLPEEVVQQVLAGIVEPGRLADLVAAYTELPTAQKQMLLETLSVEERLRRVLVHVERQISVLEAQEEIKSKVQEELGDRQREFVLREQLKAIQKELGEGDAGGELDELQEKLAALELPETVRKEVDRELGRLGRMGREGMESQVIRTYLETVLELPWSERSDEKLDLGAAAAILEEDHYALGDVKDRVLEFLAVRQLRDQARQEAPPADGEEDAEAALPGNPDDKRGAKGPILLFEGPPGVGKTSVAKSIARAMGRKYVRVSLGGVRDEADIRGHRRTYVGAMPGRILQGMKQAGTRNPVFLLDEVDKLGVSFQGDPASALLEVLDPAQNDTFTDHYLGVPFDLSEVLFIATANFLQNIPGPLLDRMEVVQFAGYTEREKLAIARRYLIPRQVAENGLSPERLAITDGAVAEVIGGYTREAGVRQLEREMGRIARKVARQVASRSEEERAAAETPVVVEAEAVRVLLGRPKVHPERASGADQVGVATGMYYTPVGGDIMFVEASTMKGKGELVMTGQLGDVMKESARAAWSYARSHADALGIPPESFERDIHIHVPAGAIPKDGPSAGVTMATALVSVLSGRPARHDVAMTGEITLSGRVLPIGGVKEKVLGAVRAGIQTVLIPRDNEADLEDLPQEVRDTLEVHVAGELGEVLALTLRGASFTGGRLLFLDAEAAGLDGGLAH
ncbi:MAG TPA: endopeptidase La [Thermoanaerobaculia bacterium]|nr:endopeptidase La [Thermoanaerobaculia bacterium]